MLPAQPAESNSRQPDFHDDLKRVMLYVETEKSEAPDSGDILGRTDSFRDMPHDFVIDVDSVPGPSTVFTTNPDEYLTLLQQATRALHERNRPEEPFDPAIYQEEDEAMAEHELIHGAVMTHFGNERTQVYYGVDFSLNPDGDLEFQPNVMHSGPLRKIHEAWAALAPDHGRSEEDHAIAASLGYDPEDRHRVRELAESTPPVEPGWKPMDAEFADRVIEQLRRMASSGK